MNRLLSLLFVLLACLFVRGQKVCESEAFLKAQDFMNGKPLKYETRASGRGMKGSKSANFSPYYVFNTEGDHGFVIISGDERAQTVLGYSDEGRMDIEDMPENVCCWLEGYAKEIEALTDNDASDSQEEATSFLDSYPAIEPLIKTKWGQGGNSSQRGAIYNTLCPVYVDGRRCVTGCVATAAAQIMYYYRCPQGMTSAIPGYSSTMPGYEEIDTSEELPPIQFNWDAMKTEYSLNDTLTESEKAVSELMLYCGYAAKMAYTSEESGSNEYRLASGVSQYFGYDSNRLKIVQSYEYTAREWHEMMYKELADGHPVMYSGQGMGYGLPVGHEFICDGYDGDGRFHINWGWDGGLNGYFFLHALKPEVRIHNSSYFYRQQSALIGLQPDSGIPFEDPNADDFSGDAIYGGSGMKVNSMEMVSSGQPGMRQSILVSVTNASENEVYNGTLELYSGTESDKGTRTSTRQARIFAGNTKEYRMSTYELKVGHHVIRLFESNTQRWLDSMIVEIVPQTLTLTHLDIIGDLEAGVNLQVNATIECHGSDRMLPIVLDAQYREIDSINHRIQNHYDSYRIGAAIEKDSSAVLTFYFQPDCAGQWSLYFYPEEEYTKRIGLDFVYIAEPGTHLNLKSIPVSDSSSEDGTLYTIEGRRLTATPKKKGIYIMNGRKVIF